MGYEITIRCDSGDGNPVTKQRCATYDRDQRQAPRYEAAASRDAIYAVERRAVAAGWQKIRKSGRPAKWICKVCHEAQSP